jgi:hypothetical protein
VNKTTKLTAEIQAATYSPTRIRGRGTGTNLSGRYESLTHENFDNGLSTLSAIRIYFYSLSIYAYTLIDTGISPTCNQ